MRRLLPLLLALPAAAETVPRDGDWTVVTAPEAVAPACDPALRPALEAMLARQAATRTVPIAWDGRFDPARLTPDETAAGAVEWAPLADGRWRGEVRPGGVPNPLAILIFEATAPDRIEGEMIVLPFNVVLATGRGMEGLRPDCTLSLTMTATTGG